MSNLRTLLPSYVNARATEEIVITCDNPAEMLLHDEQWSLFLPAEWTLHDRFIRPAMDMTPARRWIKKKEIMKRYRNGGDYEQRERERKFAADGNGGSRTVPRLCRLAVIRVDY